MDIAAAKKATLKETRENLQLMANWAGTLHRERDAALEALEEAQGKLEALMKAGVTDYSKFAGTNRVDCHFCNGVWRTEESAKHKNTCPLDRIQRGGKEEE